MSDNQLSPESKRLECPLSNHELIKLAYEWVSKLCKTGGRAFEMRVPVDLSHDADIILTEVIKRFESECLRAEQLEMKLKMANELSYNLFKQLEYIRSGRESVEEKFLDQIESLKQQVADLKQEKDELKRERDKAISFLKRLYEKFGK